MKIISATKSTSYNYDIWIDETKTIIQDEIEVPDSAYIRSFQWGLDVPEKQQIEEMERLINAEIQNVPIVLEKYRNKSLEEAKLESRK